LYKQDTKVHIVQNLVIYVYKIKNINKVKIMNKLLIEKKVGHSSLLLYQKV